MRAFSGGLASLLIAISGSVHADEILFDDFDPPALNEESWCQCQITPTKTPVNMWRDPHDQVTALTITVNESSLGGKECKPTCVAPLSSKKINSLVSEDLGEEMPESLGPPLTPGIKITGKNVPGDDPYCDDDAIQRGKRAQQEGEDPCTQRQEVRLHTHLKFPSKDVQTYSFRFRMPKEVLNKTDSIRWITAQWKQDQYDEDEYKESIPNDKGPSPVVAQRYDDGILWITVQSGLCRCVVAGASPSDTKGRPWTNGPPTDCVTIDARNPGDQCKVTNALDATYLNGGVLRSPFQTWVDMKYVMKFTAEKGNFLEVHQDGKPILKLTGAIGYKLGKKASTTKFKMGIYRDYIPQEDMIDIDWIRIGVDQ